MVTPPPVALPAVHELPSPPARPVDAGRLGVYAALGASAGALPLPWLPDALARTIRGALVGDLAARHAISLSPQARRVLADPADPDHASRTMLQQGARFVGARLAARWLAGFAPIGLYWPSQGALRVYILGRLFDRYLGQARAEAGPSIDEAEARRVRRAIDGALLGAIASGARPLDHSSPAGNVDRERERDRGGLAPEFVDRVLALAAALPERLLGRLDRAFDEGLAHGRI